MTCSFCNKASVHSHALEHRVYGGALTRRNFYFCPRHWLTSGLGVQMGERRPKTVADSETSQ